MYVVGSTVTFDITRPKLVAGETAEAITSGVAFARAVAPDGVVSSIALSVATAPTTGATGSVQFGDTLTAKGVWRYEIINDAGAVTHVIHVNAVETSTTYTSTVKF